MSDFDEYIRQGEPGRSAKAAAWQTAIGLQDVDGLKPSAYLEKFLRNLVLGENNDLKNCYLHISYQNDTAIFPKGQIGTLNVTLEERAVLNCLSQNNRIVQKEIAQVIGKSERTVKRIMASLSEKGIIIRKNGKRNGYWEVLKS